MGKKAGICSEERSMISPDYARNFICDFILGKVQKHTQLDLFKEINMKKILLFASLMLILSSCDSKSYHVKSGTAITIDGDTIEFYGGTITYPFFGQRSIRDMVIKEKGD